MHKVYKASLRAWPISLRGFVGDWETSVPFLCHCWLLCQTQKQVSHRGQRELEGYQRSLRFLSRRQNIQKPRPCLA